MLSTTKKRPTSKEFVKRTQALRQGLVQRIRDGQLRRGDLLPTEEELAKDSAISRGSVRKVMKELEEEGLISRQRGRGTIVNDGGSAKSGADGLNLGFIYPVFGRNIELLEKLKERMLDVGGLLTVYNTSTHGQNPDKERKFLENLVKIGAAGAAVSATPLQPLNTDLYRRLRHDGIKVALLTPPKYDVSDEVCFFLDTRYAGYLAGDYLIRHGCRHLAMVKDDIKAVYAYWIEEGLRRAALEHGVPFLSDPIKWSPRQHSAIIPEDLPADTGFVSRNYQVIASFRDSLLKLDGGDKKPRQHFFSCGEPYPEDIDGSPLLPFCRYPMEDFLWSAIEYLMNDALPADYPFTRNFKPVIIEENDDE